MALAGLWRALVFILIGLISVQGYALPQSKLYNAGAQAEASNGGSGTQTSFGGSRTQTNYGDGQTQTGRGGSESQANDGASQSRTSYGGGQTQAGYGGSQSQTGRGGSEGRPSSQGQTNYGGSQGQTNYGSSQGQINYGGSQGQINYGDSRGQTNYGDSRGQTNNGGSRGQINNGGSQGQTNNGGSGGQTNYGGSQDQTNDGGTPVYNTPTTALPQGGRSGSLPTVDYSYTERPVIDGSLLGLSCASNYSSEYLRNPENCTHFFRCAYGKVHDIGYCPEETVFSTIISNCVWVTDVYLNDCPTSAPSTGSRQAVGASWQQQLADLGASQISGFLEQFRHRRR